MAESALNIQSEVESAQHRFDVAVEHVTEAVAQNDQAGRTVQEQIDSIEAEIKALIDGDGKNNPSMDVLQQRYDTAEKNYAAAVKKATNREAKQLDRGLRALNYKGNLDTVEKTFKQQVSRENRNGNAQVLRSYLGGAFMVRQAYNAAVSEENRWATPKEARALRDDAVNVVNLKHEQDLRNLGESVQKELQRSVDRVHSDYPRVRQKAAKVVAIAEPIRERIVAIAEKQAELPALYEQLEVVNKTTVGFSDSLPVATAEPELFPGVDPEILNYGQDWKDKFSLSADNDDEELEPLVAANLVNINSITDHKRVAWTKPVLVVDNTSETEEVVAEGENEASEAADLDQPAEAALNEEPSAEEASLDQSENDATETSLNEEPSAEETSLEPQENDATETSVPVTHPGDTAESREAAIAARAEQIQADNGFEDPVAARQMAIQDAIKAEKAEAETGEATAADASEDSEALLDPEAAKKVSGEMDKLQAAVEGAGEAPQMEALEKSAEDIGEQAAAMPDALGTSDLGVERINFHEGNIPFDQEEEGTVIEGKATAVPVAEGQQEQDIDAMRSQFIASIKAANPEAEVSDEDLAQLFEDRMRVKIETDAPEAEAHEPSNT